MDLTKYAHACVALHKDGATIVIDPGAYTPDAARAVAGAQAVLVTHGHADHVDEAVVSAALAARPELRVYGPQAVVDALVAAGGPSDRVVAVADGDRLEVAGFDVLVVGDAHAPGHADVPVPVNVGYLVDARLYHPGDAYVAPDVPIDTLLLPTSGPWTAAGQAADFVRRVRPRRVIQIHELMASPLGQSSLARILGAQGLTGIPLELLEPGETVTV
jgi:L-ascorbate metabolism protein UlaG (beta-lactamase superfamily)